MKRNNSTHAHSQAGPFAQTLRNLRIQHAFSLADLATRTHYSRTYLSNIEHGIKAPTMRLAKACDEALRSGDQLQQLVPQQRPRRSSPPVRPFHLPADVNPFVGRRRVLAQLDRLTSQPRSRRLIVLHGEAGVGKTWLAVHWAHHARDAYPDGILYVDLHGDTAPTAHASPAAVLGSWLRALGVPDQHVPTDLYERTTLWRSLLEGRRLLVLLDNAASPAQVRPLIPASTTCPVLITSRARLDDLAIRDGAHHLLVPPFTSAEAITLLGDIIGSTTVHADPAAASTLAARSGYHPYRLRQVAEQAAVRPDMTLVDLANELAGENPRPGAPDTVDDPVLRWTRGPREDDVNKPSVSRIYDYYLGGAGNFKADRDFAKTAAEILPDIRELAMLNRAFLTRAIRHCAHRGIHQFLDIGAGLPTQTSTHHIARAINPDSRVVYVDNERVTIEALREVTDHEPGLGVVHGDFRDPAGILQHATTIQLIDYTQPVAIILGLLLHFVPDEENPSDLLAHYRQTLSPGSYVIISHDTADGREDDMCRFADLYADANRLLVLRSHTELSQLLTAFTLIEPGIVHMPLWQPDPDDAPHPHPTRTCAYAAVAQIALHASP